MCIRDSLRVPREAAAAALAQVLAHAPGQLPELRGSVLGHIVTIAAWLSMSIIIGFYVFLAKIIDYFLPVRQSKTAPPASPLELGRVGNIKVNVQINIL